MGSTLVVNLVDDRSLRQARLMQNHVTTIVESLSDLLVGISNIQVVCI